MNCSHCCYQSAPGRCHRNLLASNGADWLPLCPTHLHLLYQDAVEEFVHKESQDARQDVANMVKKFHIHDHGLVASDEGPTIAHKAHHEHNLVGQLGNNQKREGVGSAAPYEGRTASCAMGCYAIFPAHGELTLRAPSMFRVSPIPK